MADSDELRDSESGSGTPVSLTLKKGLSILSLFDSDHPEWPFTQIWKNARISRPTAFRLVRTLEEAKYLCFSPETGTYHLGVSMLKGSYLMLSPTELARIAHPYMEALERATTETVVLAAWVDHEAVVADRVLTSRPFKPDNPVGLAMPGLANVHTRIFLASRPEEEWAAALAGVHEARTPYTVTDAKALGDELAKIKREGIAIGMQEWSLDMCAVAAPVVDAAGQVRASLAVVAPLERFGPDDRAEYTAAVRKAAVEISQALGNRRLAGG